MIIFNVVDCWSEEDISSTHFLNFRIGSFFGVFDTIIVSERLLGEEN